MDSFNADFWYKLLADRRSKRPAFAETRKNKGEETPKRSLSSIEANH
jgi:hypothetical protein